MWCLGAKTSYQCRWVGSLIAITGQLLSLAVALGSEDRLCGASNCRPILGPGPHKRFKAGRGRQGLDGGGGKFMTGGEQMGCSVEVNIIP